MGGIILYIVTLALETISVLMRFAVVSSLVGIFTGRPTGLVIGIIAGLAPLVYSILVLAGIPSGHLLVRQSLGARQPGAEEQAQIERILDRVRARNLPVPRRIFTVDADGLNSAISGRTLYVYRDLYKSRFLPAVIAHELGHFNSMDGRLLLAIRGLTIPGGFLIAYVLLSLLRWVAYAISMILIGMIYIVFALFRLRLGSATSALFNLSYTLLRMVIIFAVGGIGPALLGSIWSQYFLEREFAADAYAAKLGYADDLMEFFETEVLSDVEIPWYRQPTHPPTRRRIDALFQLSRSGSSAERAPAQPRMRETQRPPSTPPRSTPQLAASAAPGAGASIRQHRLPPWLLPLAVAAVVLTLSIGALITRGIRQDRGSSIQPTPGPTPTLGVLIP